MNVYDKAKWHLDQPNDSRTTENKLKHLSVLMDWLNKNSLLNEDGKEIFELGVDQEFSLTSEMVTTKGEELLDKYYTEWTKNLSYDEGITTAFWDSKL